MTGTPETGHIVSGTREIPSEDQSATRVPPSSTLLLASFDDAPQTKQSHFGTGSKNETSIGPLHPGSQSSAPPRQHKISSQSKSIQFPKIQWKSWTFPRHRKSWNRSSQKSAKDPNIHQKSRNHSFRHWKPSSAIEEFSIWNRRQRSLFSARLTVTKGHATPLRTMLNPSGSEIMFDSSSDSGPDDEIVPPSPKEPKNFRPR